MMRSIRRSMASRMEITSHHHHLQSFRIIAPITARLQRRDATLPPGGPWGPRGSYIWILTDPETSHSDHGRARAVGLQHRAPPLPGSRIPAAGGGDLSGGAPQTDSWRPLPVGPRAGPNAGSGAGLPAVSGLHHGPVLPVQSRSPSSELPWIHSKLRAFPALRSEPRRSGTTFRQGSWMFDMCSSNM